MVVDVLVKKVVINFTYKIGTPAFTFTGNYKIENEGQADWKIYFLTSGTLTFTEEPSRIDVFFVDDCGSGLITAWSNYDGESGDSGGGNGEWRERKKTGPGGIDDFA